MKYGLAEKKRIAREQAAASRKRKAVISSLASHTPPKTYKTIPGTRIRIDDDDIGPAPLPDSEGVTSWSLAFVSVVWRQAAIDLRNAGYSVWSPMITKYVTHARLRKKVHVPLFPGYLFVGRKPGPTMAIKDIMGVQFLVDEKLRLNIRPSVFQIFADAQEAGAYDEASRTDPITLQPIKRDPVTKKVIVGFRKGSMVEANAGPFAGLFGEVMKMSAADRVAVMLRVVTEQGASEKLVEFPVGMVQEVAA